LVSPYRVVLRRGEVLNWDVRIDQTLGGIELFRIEIYFPGESPFNFGRTTLFRGFSPSFRTLELSAGRADDPGEYKYGVRIMDNSSDRLIEDEDPYIMVQA